MRNDECRMTNARMPRFCIQHSTFCILHSAFASRLPYFAQAVVEQFPLVGVCDVLPQEGFRALRGQLSRVLRQLVTGVLETVVDFIAGGGEDLLRFRFGGGDQLALLPLSLLLGALV